MATLGPDLLLDPLTGDLAMEGGSFLMGVDVRQAIYIRLSFFKGEWFLDREKGVPYYERVFQKAPNFEHVAAIIRATILDTPGVLDVVRFVFTFDSVRRILRIEWTANTDEGEIGDVSEVPL